MPQTYTYKTRDNLGRYLTGQMEADSERAVALNLRQQGQLVISINPLETKKTFFQDWKIAIPPRITIKDLSVFCRQFGTMLDAGLPLVSCLQALLVQSENKHLGKIIGEITREIEGGKTLTQAFSQYPHIFPNLFLSLVQVGETTGTIDTVLTRLATYYEKEYELKEKVKSAMTYPIVVMIMSGIIVIFLLTFVLPMFEGIYKSLNVTLPLPTQLLLDISKFFKNSWFIVCGFLGFIFYELKTYAQTEQGKILFTKIKMLLPVFGSLGSKVSFARFSLSLSIMTSSGVQILQALEVAKDTLDNSILAKEVDGMIEVVRSGGSMAVYLEANKNFPTMMTKLIAIGEMTGSLDTMLNKIADFYEKEAQFIVDRLAALLEPFMVAFLGVIVGSITLSVMYPMLKLIGSLGNIGGH